MQNAKIPVQTTLIAVYWNDILFWLCVLILRFTGLSVGFWAAGSVHKVAGSNKACTPFNTMPRTNLAVRVAGSVFGIAGEMRRLPAYFDNPGFSIALIPQGIAI